MHRQANGFTENLAGISHGGWQWIVVVMFPMLVQLAASQQSGHKWRGLTLLLHHVAVPAGTWRLQDLKLNYAASAPMLVS
jgi:hypothetical protein